MKNYFRVGTTTFLFDDESPLATQTAYVNAVRACVAPQTVAVWRMPKLLGPWSQADLIGYRSERDIKADIAMQPDDEELTALWEELFARREAVGVSV